jgi:hypothetical protein
VAFENNQQDAFNLRNDTESLKQWQSELDKATTSIGAAEVAAEEELAAEKLKNLAEQQKTRLKQIEQLLALEEAGIRELAELRLTLSEKQFEARKKELQKEYKLTKVTTKTGEARNKKRDTSSEKSTTPRNFTSDTSKLKKVDLGRFEFEEVAASFEALREQLSSSALGALNKVVANKDTTPQASVDFAGELLENFDAAEATIRKVREFNEKQELNAQLLQLSEEQQLKKKHAEASFNNIKAEIAAIAKEQDILNNSKAYEEEAAQKLSLEHITKENALRLATIDAEARAQDLTNNKAFYLLEEKWALEKTYLDAQNRLVEDRIKAEATFAYTAANRDKLIAQEEQKLKNTHDEATLKAMQTNIAITAKKNDLEHNRRIYAQEEYRARGLAFLEEQNKLTAEEINAEAKLKFVKNNEERLLDQAAHKLRIEHINAEHNAMQALINAQAKADDIKNNREQYLEEALQNLKAGHAQKENELRLAGINAEAKATDIENNRKAYALEAELARENAIAEERNRLNEELIKAETEIAVNAAHRKELLDQEEQKARLGYLAEYQKLQADGFSHLTENMTKEQFIALKEQTKAAEDSIARREKASEFAEKTLATLRGKGTAAEKKALLEAQIKQRAAEKDWSDAKRMQQRDGESDEELQKRRENATKAEDAANSAMEALANLAQQLNAQTDKIGAKKAPIDTRLQGSKANDTILGSYWKQLARDMNKIGAVNPYFKQEDFANNIEALVNRGISFDIKQRAFLMTIQEKIANTFNVADGTLLRLIRIQQQDTTAGRLGMESALNSFLNSMYETSEYLTDVAASVRGSLEEMQALMEGAAGTELEFQVQKWMGSLYSVGMSQDAVQSIAQTFGQIASGDVNGLTGSGTGNLLIMAANEAGMSIADILQDGLDAKETNELMQAMVNYLAEIAETSSDSRVVQQQLANVYGMRASDLKAATNLASSIKDVSKQDLTYSGMLGQLNKMANSMFLRTSQGEALSNIWSNVQYTMATQMSNDPILYLLPKVATLLEDYAGGIDLPFLNVMGFGVDLNTSVAQLMNVAAMGGTILGALGPMISGLGSAVSGTLMLNNAGINTSGKAPVIARGSAQPLQHLGGVGISESGYIGNSSGEDVKKATLQDAEDDKKKQMIKAKDEESADDTATKANFAVVNIYNLLEEVAHGSQSLRVRVINNNGIGSAGGAGGVSAGTGGTTSPIGDGSGGGSTGGMGSSSLVNGATGGVDNGNWVLAF